MAMKNHKVTLAGNRFVIKSDVSEARIREIEAFLDDKFARMGGRGQRLAFHDGLVLLLFHVTDLMLDAEQGRGRLAAGTAEKLRGLRDEVVELQKLVRSRLDDAS
jgi:hypothetical protein